MSLTKVFLLSSEIEPFSSTYSLSNFAFDFGESRVQEALPKLDSLKDLIDIRWHFIGSLQANKVRQVVRKFDIIHSVDSLKLAKRISRIA